MHSTPLCNIMIFVLQKIKLLWFFTFFSKTMHFSKICVPSFYKRIVNLDVVPTNVYSKKVAEKNPRILGCICYTNCRKLVTNFLVPKREERMNLPLLLNQSEILSGVKNRSKKGIQIQNNETL